MESRVLTVLAGAPVGGAESFFTSLTVALSEAGFAVSSVLRPSAEREAALAAAGISFKTAAFGSALDWGTKPVIRAAAAAFRPDIVLAFAGRAASFVPQGPYRIVGRLGGYYNLSNFRHCDHLVCNSPDVMRHVLSGGWPQSRATLIPNFAFVPPAPHVSRSEFDTPDTVPLAVALGRLHRNKGHDVLIRAAARLPDLHVWIVGEGPERDNLERLVHELRLGDRIRLPGWRNDRAAIYGAADLCVYPSREEPFGNIVVEAWSCGVPLVATRTAGPSWLVREGEDGLLVPPDDADALADAIRHLLHSPMLAPELISAGRKRVTAEFSRTAVVARYADLFRSLNS